jgi:ribonucleotide monophosphatase NagD (HAD superfamily)
MSLINTTLTDIWTTHHPTAIVVDAAGLLYTDLGPVPGAAEAIAFMSATVPVWVATNNTNYSPEMISTMLADMGIGISAHRIISSGLGLAVDTELREMVHGKRVFTYGYPSSQWYARYAGGVAVSTPDEAQVIVLAASTGATNAELYRQVAQSLRQTPHRPVICINPDFYVQTGAGLHPVIGYYADQLSRDCDISIQWMGKPYSSFSEVVRQYLEQSGVVLSKQVWFFDDNPKNVDRLTRDLGISGAVAVETGLTRGLSEVDWRETFGVMPAVRIHSFKGDWK